MKNMALGGLDEELSTQIRSIVLEKIKTDIMVPVQGTIKAHP